MSTNEIMLPVKEHLKSLERIQNPMARGGYLRLDKNENIAGFENEFVESLRQEITSDFLTTYPEISPLRQKIAHWLGCNEESIYITAGSDAAIKSVFEVFVEPQDIVVLPSPTYAMFYVYTEMFQARLIEIHYKEDLSLSSEDILRVVHDDKPKLLCIANPNSPTGTTLPQEDLINIIAAADKQHIITLLDEAYYLFYPETVINLISDYPSLVVIRTFSKAMGLASARLGFAAAHPGTTRYLRKVRPIYETNAFAVRFAELVLDNMQLVERNLEEINRGKKYLEKELDRLGIPYFKSYTNFTLIDVGSFEKSVQLGNALFQRKILIRSGFRDNVLRNCIRVTTGNVEQMKLFMKTFNEVYSPTNTGTPDNMRQKVFISTSSFGKFDSSPLELLKTAELDVQLNPHHRTLSREEIISLGAQSEGLIAGTEVLDAEVIRKLNCLRVISRCGAGLDNVDINAAKKQCIQVFSTPHGPTSAVAELTVALILSLLRHVNLMDRDMRAGKWQKRMGHLLQGKKVGIIGFGKVGQKVAELLQGLGTQIAYCDPAVVEIKADYKKMTLGELLAWSDIITIHASGKNALLGYDELRRMQRGSWLVNCARGSIVDEKALCQVLEEGRLFGAALDVFEKEPYEGPLSRLDNVILTPHIGSYAKEARVEMEIDAARNLIAGLKR